MVDDRCPRCDDYDEVVEELKKEKDARERGAKDELRKCEEKNKSRDKKIKTLEKKILTMTIAAVVGGTIVGKDVLDKITQYIQSFNSIKDAATKLTTSTDNGSDKEVAKEDNEQQENDYINTLTFAPRKIDTGEWPSFVSNLGTSSSTNQSSSISYLPSINDSFIQDFINPPTLIDMLIDDMIDDVFTTNDYVMWTDSSEVDALSSFGVETDYTQDIVGDIYYTEQQVYVPESHAWLLLGVPIVFCKRRRR
jgi:thiol-disulfide isomerase/thioredoxin